MVDSDGGTLVIERCVLVNIEIVTRVNQRTVMDGIGGTLAVQRCVVILLFLFLPLSTEEELTLSFALLPFSGVLL